ncbi:bifunctional oligoribonuclease and PAP phosphatase NrnA [Desulfovibrionales bacterium]
MVEPRERVCRLLKEGSRFLVAGHDNPDGDALGASVALCFILDALGKEFRLYNASGMPECFYWITLPGPMYDSIDPLADFGPEWIIILDCGDSKRMGRELMFAADPKRIVNIDHHPSNTMFGAINWVDTNMCATGHMIALLAQDIDVPLTGPLAEAIYLAIVADTGNFCYGNTTPTTLQLAVDILLGGLDITAFNDKYLHQWTFNRIRLWSEVLQCTHIYSEGRIALVTISMDMMKRTNTTHNDCDGLAEFIRRIRGVDVSIAVREESQDCIKFSLRSRGKINVQHVAAAFGGGGHANAAGGKVMARLTDAAVNLITAVERLVFTNIPGPSDQATPLMPTDCQRLASAEALRHTLKMTPDA